MQTCSIDIAVRSLDKETVNLVLGHLTMSQDANMAIFRLVEWTLVNKRFQEDKRGISMVVVMKRKITSEMMTTYFPTMMLTTITFATTFFKPYFFEAALTVNLTTMLVMTTIFIAKMDRLPPTSDIKMIDVWLVMCQLVPFCEVVLLTAIEYNRTGEQNESKEETKKVNHHGATRVVKLNEKETKSATNEKPEEAWSGDDGEEYKLSKSWVPSLKSIRKFIYQDEFVNISICLHLMINQIFRDALSPNHGCFRLRCLLSSCCQLLSRLQFHH